MVYFENLVNKLNVAKALMGHTKSSLKPFRDYLQNAIDAMREKQVSARWKKVNADLVQLVPISRVYKVIPHTIVEIDSDKNWYKITPTNVLPENFKPNYQDDILIRSLRERISIDEESFKIDGGEFFIKLDVDEAFSEISWGFDDWQAEPAWSDISQVYSVSQPRSRLGFVEQNTSGQIVIRGDFDRNSPLFINGTPCKFKVVGCFDEQILYNKNVKILEHNSHGEFTILGHVNCDLAQVDEQKDYYEQIDFDTLRFVHDSSLLECVCDHRLVIQVESKDDCVGKKVTSAEGIQFSIEDFAIKPEDEYWIYLLELDEDIEQDAASQSPLEYFFDEDIEIYDDKNLQYEVLRKREDDEGKKLILKNPQNGRACLPHGEVLTVRVNTYNLRMQKDAIYTLSTMPVAEQRNLIKLFENRDRVRWDRFSPESITQWQVLTDDRRSGAEEQREFVKKAIATKDFAILEGPPGSGKTTVILELIYQIVKRGGRILLCGSTHVAVDNVLERLENYGMLSEVLPVRIGNEWRIRSDYVRENFQLNYVVEKHGISERLLLESANLVCGTTIGILQHPFFKNRDSRIAPATPDFDYMIIDECSKTTFQEFLVPALYAKKWILVGDPKQLSPYTERDHIVANFRHLKAKDKSISTDLQNACFYLHVINKRCPRCIFSCSPTTMSYLLDEVKLRGYDKDIFFVGRLPKNERVIKPEHLQKQRLRLTAADVIFVDHNEIDKLIAFLPENMIVLNYLNWLETTHSFRHNARYRKKRNKTEDSFEIAKSKNEDLKERSWAEEIAWRLIRMYELRQTNKKVDFLQSDIDELLPKTQDLKSQIQSVEDIALPSIIEGLQNGIRGKRKTETTLTQGFSKDELQSRHTVLVYQHRMHPQISDLPRILFYTKKSTTALKDSVSPLSMMEARDWNYKRYRCRRIWIDVNGHVIRNSNLDEVKKMKKELEQFCTWAKNNPKDNNEKWEVACLTFYRGQESKMRDMLRKFCKQERKFSQFSRGNVEIKLYTVDKFQGQEADFVLLSMVQTRRDGFLDSPNRLNVSITRARYQLAILGSYEYFTQKSKSLELKELANKTQVMR